MKPLGGAKLDGQGESRGALKKAQKGRRNWTARETMVGFHPIRAKNRSEGKIE